MCFFTSVLVHLCHIWENKKHNRLHVRMIQNSSFISLYMKHKGSKDFCERDNSQTHTHTLLTHRHDFSYICSFPHGLQRATSIRMFTFSTTESGSSSSINFARPTCMLSRSLTFSFFFLFWKLCFFCEVQGCLWNFLCCSLPVFWMLTNGNLRKKTLQYGMYGILVI